MKWFLVILFLVIHTAGFPQDNPSSLARQLTASCKNEREKVTAIFRWITENISYRIKPVIKKQEIVIRSLEKYSGEASMPDDGPLKPLNERVAETVLQKREAICEGYARLFTTLCDYSGICSAIIPGFAKNKENIPAKRFGVNHYWNAVMIDGVWHLLDVTWASGYISLNGNEFIREYDNS